MKIAMSILALIMAICHTLVAQVAFRVDAPAIATNDETISVRFLLRDARGSNFRAPGFSGFRVVSGPKKSSFSQDGHQYESYEFQLIPFKLGTLRIEPALIYAGNSAIRSNSAEVRVSESVTSRGQNQTQLTITNPDKPFLQSNIREKHGYTNYPVVLTYRLFVPAECEVSFVDVVKKIGIERITSREIDVSREQPTEKIVQGKKYRVFVLKKYVLTALSAQSLATGEFNVRGESVIYRKDEFGRKQRIPTEFVASCPSVFLQFDELPQPKPEPNALPCRNLTALSEIGKSSFRVGETAVFKLRLSGSGALESIEQPMLDLPSGIALVSQSTNDEIHYGDSAVFGSRTFEYSLEFREEGNFEVPAVAFVYFDVDKGGYSTVTAMAKRVSVGSASTATDTFAIGANTNRSIWIAVLAIVLVIALFVWAFILIRKRKTKSVQDHSRQGTPKGSPPNEQTKDADTALEVLCGVLEHGDLEKFFSLADSFVRGYFSEEGKPKPTNEDIEQIMIFRGFTQDRMMTVSSIIERIEYAVYTSTYSHPAADSVLTDMIRAFATSRNNL